MLVPVSLLDIFEKVLPALITGSIVILVFVVGRVIDASAKARGLKRDWYLKVIIDPHLDRISNFYESIFEQVEKSQKVLVDSSSIPHIEYLTLVNAEIGLVQEIKRKFELEFILMVQSNYPRIAQELSDHLIELEDLITAHLASSDVPLPSLEELQKSIVSFRTAIYRILYKPLKI